MFVVTATGPTGVYWLSKPSDIGLRRLVAWDQAELFPTFEDAELAIKKMPEGYKFAGISFAIELSGELHAARAELSAEGVRHVSDEPESTMSDVRHLQGDEPETISDAAGNTIGDVPAGEPKTSRMRFWRALARLLQR